MGFKIGIMVDSLRLPFEQGIRKAVEMGADGIQLSTTGGPMAPENLSKERRREVRSMMDDIGLEFSALCGDFGLGFTDPETSQSVIERTRPVMDLAADWGISIVTTHIGHLADDMDAPQNRECLRVCRELGRYGEERGVMLATETGPEYAIVLRKLLDEVASPAIKVNLDPANLVLYKDEDPVASVWTLRNYIVHTHAKDALYTPRAKARGLSNPEVPLGEGEVDFPLYIRALHDIGYNGYLTIEREVGENPEADIRMAIGFLKKTIAELGL